MLKLVMLFALVFGSGQAYASVIGTALQDATKRGEAVFRYYGVPVYKAQLFTKNGQEFEWSSEFGLQLTYLRNIPGEALVESTMVELERLGGTLPVRGQLEQCFGNVSKGDSYLAVPSGPNEIDFWLNGSRTCTLAYPQIKYRFMAIFLGDQTRSKRFTSRLRGR